MRTRKRVLHVITGLPVGGTQTVLHQLASHRNDIHCEMSVVSLTETGAMGNKIAELGVDVRGLEMRRSVPNPLALLRLRNWIRRNSPDIVQTWLYHGDLIGGIAARSAGVSKIFWNLRQTDLDPAGSKRSTRWTARACAKISRHVPDRIICCSESAREIHTALGYDQSRMLVIGNGVDLDSFRPSTAHKIAIRNELGISADSPLIGMAARYHPQKGHETFLSAAAALRSQLPDVHFVLCGENVTRENPQLNAATHRLGIADCVHLLGIRDDLARLNAAFDLAVSSSSFGEGFSNVIIEAMACGTPCAVTDVGDSHLIVGDTGWKVPPKDPKAMSDAWHAALSLPPHVRLRMGDAARERALKEFSLDRTLSAYRNLYHES